MQIKSMTVINKLSLYIGADEFTAREFTAVDRTAHFSKKLNLLPKKVYEVFLLYSKVR